MITRQMFWMPRTGARFRVMEASADGLRGIAAGERAGGCLLGIQEAHRYYARQVEDNRRAGTLLDTLTSRGWPSVPDPCRRAQRRRPSPRHREHLDPRKAAAMATGDPYPSPSHISYNENSRWCQEHGHTGLLIGSACGICDHLVASDPRFAAVLGTEHSRDGSRVKRKRP